MVQKAKIKFFSLLSIIIGFFSTYLVTPIRNKVVSEKGESVEFRLIRTARSQTALPEFRLIRTTRPQVAVRAAAPPPVGGTYEVQSTNPVLTIQKLKFIRTDGQPMSIQRNVDVPAFESWLNSKGVEAKYLSADAVEELYNEFRLDNISNQLDRIEKLLSR